MVLGSWAGTLALGGVVGLGVAMPLGAIGVLLLHTGMTRGWRPAAAGGLGAALVDLTYAALAVAAGTAVAQALAGREGAVRAVGAAVLAVVAAAGLRRVLREREVVPDGVPGRSPDAAPGAGRTLARFAGLTALNPLTVVYFTAVAAGLGERLGTTTDRVAFVVGIGAASAAWQLGLAGAGAVLGARVRPAVRTVLGAAGYVVVGGFAVVLALG